MVFISRQQVHRRKYSLWCQGGRAKLRRQGRWPDQRGEKHDNGHYEQRGRREGERNQKGYNGVRREDKRYLSRYQEGFQWVRYICWLVVVTLPFKLLFSNSGSRYCSLLRLLSVFTFIYIRVIIVFLCFYILHLIYFVSI